MQRCWALIGIVVCLAGWHLVGVESQCSTNCRTDYCDTSTGICYSCMTGAVEAPNGICTTACSGNSGSFVSCQPNSFRAFCGVVCNGAATFRPTGASTTGAGDSGGLSGTVLGIIIGVSVGVLIIAAGVIFVIYFFRTRREMALAQASTHINMREIRRAPSNSNMRSPAARGESATSADPIMEEEDSEAAAANPPAPPPPEPQMNSDREQLSPSKALKVPIAITQLSAQDRDVLFSKMDEIRPHASSLLEILNATNKVLRSGDNSDPQNLKLAMNDMAAVLRLIHRKPNKITTIPENAVVLVTWAAGLVSSYRASRGQGEETEGV